MKYIWDVTDLYYTFYNNFTSGWDVFAVIFTTEVHYSPYLNTNNLHYFFSATIHYLNVKIKYINFKNALRQRIDFIFVSEKGKWNKLGGKFFVEVLQFKPTLIRSLEIISKHQKTRFWSWRLYNTLYIIKQ